MGRPGRDEQAAHDRQDLREGIFARAKTDLDRTRWSRDWPWSRKRCRPRGHRTSSGKSSGKRSAGNPPAPFDEAGTGDVTMGAGLRPKAKGLDKPPDPTVRAPVLDPTGRGRLDSLVIKGLAAYLMPRMALRASVGSTAASADTRGLLPKPPRCSSTRQSNRVGPLSKPGG